jgi:hypothetical protein
MPINPQLPSSRLRDDLNGLERWARMAPPLADECDWGYDHYATNIRSKLAQLDRDFEALQNEFEALQNELRKK